MANGTFNFAALPREIRLHILYYTDLIFHNDSIEHHVCHGSGITIYNGLRMVRAYTKRPIYGFEDEVVWPRCEICDSKDPPFRFPTALFLVNKQMNADASEVFWGMQRFVLLLNPNYDASIKWLNSLREQDVRRIRTLEVETDDHFVLGVGYLENNHVTGWRRVIETIAQRCNLENMWLSINAGSSDLALSLKDAELDYDWVDEDFDPNMLDKTYRRMMKIVKDGFEGRRLRKFYLFLSWGIEGESIAEQEIMGPNYDSGKEGKIPYAQRDSRNLHWRLQETDKDWDEHQRHWSKLEKKKMGTDFDDETLWATRPT